MDSRQLPRRGFRGAKSLTMVLLWVSLYSGDADGLFKSPREIKRSRKRTGKHAFPATNEHETQLANEFQLLYPGNIKRKVGVSSEEYTITEVTPLLINNDDEVTVTFSTSDPVSSDWIAAYSPADADITKVVPVKYGWCNDDDNYMTDGQGVLYFNMTNLRSDIKFYYFSNGLTYPNLQASFEKTVDFENYNQPLKQRVVPTGNYDVLKLAWSSAVSATPTLKWGTAKGGPYSTVVAASTDHITIDQVCGAPANTTGWFDTGLIHIALFEGMKALAGQNLYYIFGDEETDDFSDEVKMWVPPLPGQQSVGRGTRVVLFDDLGRGSTDDTYTWYEYGRPSVYTMYSIGAEVNAGNVDAIYHGGDISYATGYLSVWDFFLDMISPVAGAVPYMTTVGNHESDWWDSASQFSNADSGGECGVMTTRLIPMPEPATTNQPWWSYDVGLIHFVGMSTEHDFNISSTQWKWLEADLAGVDRTVTPWIIFGGHRAMYINSDYGGTVTSDITLMEEMVANLEPMLWKYRVNIGFYGHNHVVQRQSAVYNYTVVQKSAPVEDEDGNVVHVYSDPQATVHMIIGTGGGTFTKTAIEPGPEWNELFFYEYGYAIVEAINATTLAWKWVLGTTNEVLDRVIISQGDPTTPWVLPRSTA